MAIVIPELETERLSLIPLSTAHSAGMFALWSHPKVCRYSGEIKDFEGNPISSPVNGLSESDKILIFWLKACAAGWGFRWALILKSSMEFAGTAGFNSLGECSEYAYHLHPDQWGKGFMLEASYTVLEWLAGERLSHEIEVFIEPENIRSITLAVRLGFIPTDEYSSAARRYVRVLERIST